MGLFKNVRPANAMEKMANYDWSNFDTNIAKNMALANEMNTTLDNTLTEDIDINSLRDPFQPFNTYDRGFQTGLDEQAAAEELQANQLNQNYGQFFRNRPVNERNFMSPINEGIGSFKTNVGQKIGQGWDFAQQLPGMAMSALSGIPGIGALMGMLPKTSPEQKAMMDLYNSGEYQDVLGQIPGAENLNPVYGMGSGYGLSGALGKRLAMRNSQKTQNRIAKLSQQRQDKFAAQSAAIEQAIALEKAQNFARTGASGRRPGSGGGGQGTPDSGGTTGGYSYDSGGRLGYGYGLKYGGRVGYGNGGLATLFTRRG